jgi:hypothetical protein
MNQGLKLTTEVKEPREAMAVCDCQKHRKINIMTLKVILSEWKYILSSFFGHEVFSF